MLSENFQTGLQNLKAVAETRRAAAQAAPAEAAPVGHPRGSVNLGWSSRTS